MSEGLRARDVITKPRVVFAAFLASVAFAGCGNTKSADSIPVGTCGHHDYSKAESSHPSESVPQALATAREDVLTLQKRALRAGGSINLPRYNPSGGRNDTTEINASQDNLTLNFDRSGAFTSPRVDHINFPISQGVAHISEGAIMCFDDSDNQLTVNGTFTTLRQYVHETAALRE